MFKKKVHLFVPEEGTAPSKGAVVSLDEVPQVGDFIHTGELAPEAGPGASDRMFRVVERVWSPTDIPHLTVTRAREREYR